MRLPTLLLVLGSLAAAHPVRNVEVQAHRGGLGLRPESTLPAFAYALTIGADVLEMDLVFTKDGVPVIWHDHRISEKKCTGLHVGKLIYELTLKELKTLDCGSLPQENHVQQLPIPGARIPTLEEILDLVDCWEDKKVELNIETKIDPLTPDETWPAAKYISDVVPLLKRRGYDRRSYIQSFDWRTLIGIKTRFPSVRTVALVDATTVVPDDGRGIGHYPWLGGIDLEKDFKGDWVTAAKSIGASVLSPSHGKDYVKSVNSPGYVAFTTRDVVRRAHRLRMTVVPWTVDDESSIRKVVADGVDGVISNYPERIMFVTGQKVANKERKHCLKMGY